jgi:hypothetical protein
VHGALCQLWANGRWFNEEFRYLPLSACVDHNATV